MQNDGIRLFGKNQQWLLKQAGSVGRVKGIGIVSEYLSTRNTLNTNGKIVTLWYRDLAETKWSRLTRLEMRQTDTRGLQIGCTKKITCWTFLPTCVTWTSHEESSDKPTLGGILQNKWAVFFKTSVMNSKDRLQNSSRWKATWQLNTVYRDPGFSFENLENSLPDFDNLIGEYLVRKK